MESALSAPTLRASATERAHRRENESPATRASVITRAGIIPWVPIWLGCGIGGWFALPVEPGWRFYTSLVSLIALSAFAGIILRRRARQGRMSWPLAEWLLFLLLCVSVMAAGAGLAGIRAHAVAAPVLDFRYYGPVQGRVLGIDRSSSDRIRLLLDQVVIADVAPDKTPQRVRISLLSDQTPPQPGDRVMMTAHLGPPNGPAEPGGFDYRRVAWFERLGAIGYTRTQVMRIAPAPVFSLFSLHQLRMNLSAAIQDRIEGQAGAIAAALMTGDRSGIAETTNQVMRDSNLYHIISISGLHMSMLAGFLYAALRYLGAAVQGWLAPDLRHVHKPAALGALIGATFYLWLSGGGVATERAYIMVAVMLAAILLDRRAISLRTVAVAATLVLVWQPESLINSGFQMSFAATVALIIAHEPWMRWSSMIPRWTRPLAMLVFSSLIAGMATAPISAIHFGRLTHYGLIANLLVVPAVGSLVMPAGVLAAILAPLGLAAPALWIMGLGTEWLIQVAGAVSHLKGAVTLVPQAPASTLPLLALGASLAVLGPVSPIRIRALEHCRRACGFVLIAAATLNWLTATRPAILISAERDAVAIMTAQGRVPSSATGGKFAVKQWLEADGDPVTQTRAAERPLWEGPPGHRVARLADGLEVHHLRTPIASLEWKGFCQSNTIVIVAAQIAGEKYPLDCKLVDKSSSLDLGALSMKAERNLLLIENSGNDGGRVWQ
ncbi:MULTISPECIES: ComEC/Rec2 family competence protein [unclassified Paracoccus (in: a-proteobacteria)]|uniref:ComEC/Rec2 family competence protein n=1 Tax=unclassified Paracoccus (in: a-proteobacteria) TaxID=2688777 RepID=UPI0012B37692|nr:MULTISPECIES: ComEC/Rec2 family competence protein [unclassified Paracoccus (in: a-proteobacteria)]UXU74573.1 ComEC family competence protein [Paracoccus sp. SMMA_5]UXU80467.1 ComEC family competence protein [Paracoccus sp. SMMA_5_TC]